MSLLAELKRRNVIRVGLAYVVAGWLLVQVLEIAADSFEAPAWVMKFAITLIAVGLVPTLIFSWVYEITPEGIKREVEVDRSASVTAETGQKLNIAVIVLLVLAIGLFAVDRFLVGRHAPPPVEVAAAPGPAAATDGGDPGPAAAAPASPQPVPESETAAARDASVAVLPFTTRSASDDDRYFSDGVHDDLLTQLAKIGSLKVISRTSVMDYRDTTKRIPDIAAELGVATIVEGAVQRSGSKVRITAQLIDAQTDEHLWAESYDRELTADNLFEIQTEIATSIAGALQATLSPEEKAALQRRLTDDLPAREAYQRAKWLLFSLQPESLEQAQRELEFALERDADFAAAWAQLAQTHLAFYWWGIDPVDSRRVKAREAIDRGRTAAPELPELDIAEGYYYYWGFRDYRAALDVLEPALEAYPNDAGLQGLVAFVNRRLGRFDLALKHLERALELDPRSGIVMAELTQTNARLGNYEAAQRYLQLLERTQPEDPQVRWLKALMAVNVDGDPQAAAGHWAAVEGQLIFAPAARLAAQLAAGDYAAALETAARIDARQGSLGPSGYTTALTRYLSDGVEAARPELEKALAGLDPATDTQLGPLGPGVAQRCQLLGALGDAKAAAAACDKAAGTDFGDAFIQPTIEVNIAGGLAMVGLADRAFDVLRQAIASPVGPSRNQLRLDPFLRKLRDNPEWEQLIEEAKP